MRSFYRILVINPGSTLTKIGVFDDGNCIFKKIIPHEIQKSNTFNSVIEACDFRKGVILAHLDYEGINISKLSAVCARGGLLQPIEGGTYRVNESMLRDLKIGFNGEHTSNLGGIIAHKIADGLNIDAYIVDPVVVDELDEIARYSGVPEIPRKSIFHALNQKAVARKTAIDLKTTYESMNLIVAHMGEGITIGAHQNGRVIDVNNGLDGEGPFSPERAGTVPAGDLVSLCFSGSYNLDEVMGKIVGQGGLIAYLKTNDALEIERRIKAGDLGADQVYEAMAYQIAKNIGAMGTALSGKVDAIILTGRLAYGKMLIEKITKRVKWIADIIVYPGENELLALNEGVLRVLRGEERPKVYPNNESIKEYTTYDERI